MDSEAGSCLLEEDSEVFKMLQENREARVAPRQSSSFRLLQEALEAEERGEAAGLHGKVIPGPPGILPSQAKEVVFPKCLVSAHHRTGGRGTRVKPQPLFLKSLQFAQLPGMQTQGGRLC